MKIKSIRDSSVGEMFSSCDAFMNACGYEARSGSLARRAPSEMQNKISISFQEFASELSRPENERLLRVSGFQILGASGGDSSVVAGVVSEFIANPEIRSIGIDISSMTRAWHGGIVRALRSGERASELHTFFGYVPATFTRPPGHAALNEVVAPVDGFASLVTPDLPIALIIGLGYEKDRALGLQQLLDPKRTVIMIPRFRTRIDQFHYAVLKANRELLESVPRDSHFEYWIDEPSGTFGQLASIVSGLIPNYRVVLASLGPKMFGLVGFLLATRMPQVSVWRASSGIHSRPRESKPDENHAIVLRVTWTPEHF